jgi:hypothetical protein
MRDYLVSYLRLLGFSLCLLAVALCMRFGPAANAATPAPEPRFSAPPREAHMAAFPLAPTEEEQVASLETNLMDLSAEIADLTLALDVLGPLPDHPELFIPVMLSDSEDSAPGDTVRRFSPVARSGNSHCGMPHAGLGVLAGLHRRISGIGGAPASYDAPFHNVRMDWNDVEDATLAALCVELSAISGPPRVVAPIRAG